MQPPLPPVVAPTLGIWSTGDAYLTECAMVRSADHVSATWRYVQTPDLLALADGPCDQPRPKDLAESAGYLLDRCSRLAILAGPALTVQHCRIVVTQFCRFVFKQRRRRRTGVDN